MSREEYAKSFDKLKKTFDEKTAILKAAPSKLPEDQKNLINDLVLNHEEVYLHDLPNAAEPYIHVYLSQQLQRIQGITALTFPNKIPDGHADECVGYLALGLENQRELSELDLSSNNITSRGAYYLTQTLRKNSNLRVLRLNRNLIGDTGVPFIAEAIAIAQSKNLQLSLSKNSIRDIKPLIATLGCLASLDLSENSLGDAAVSALASALESNTTLKKLKLDSVNMGPKGADALIAMLQKNHTLTELELGKRSDTVNRNEDNYLTKAQLEKINKLLKRNQFADPLWQANAQATYATTKRSRPLALTGGFFLLAGGIVLLGAAALGFLGFFSLGFLLPGIAAGVLACGLGVAVLLIDCCVKRCQEKYCAPPPSTYSVAMNRLEDAADNEADNVRLLPNEPTKHTPSPLAPPKKSAKNQPSTEEAHRPIPLITPTSRPLMKIT